MNRLYGLEFLSFCAQSRPLTLLEIMKRFSAHSFFKLAADLERLSGTCLTLDPSTPVPTEVNTTLADIESRCSEIGLRLSIKLLRRMMVSISRDGMSIQQFRVGLGELQMRIEDEMADQLFTYISTERAEYFEKSDAFGPEVSRAFPAAIFDIAEAANCYAAGRYTACVMHTSRVLETALRVVGAALDVVGIEHLPSWDSILVKINEQLEKRREKKPPGWSEQEAFYAEAAAFLRAVQKAWRNPSMHVDKTYTPEHALDIFKSVGVFMKHLASKLTERNSGT